MKKKFTFFYVLCFIIHFTFSQSIPSELIKSISFQKPNDNISNSTILSGLNEKFSISFDVLSGIEFDLYYVIEHCDFDWEKSQLLKSEYLSGFDEVKIENYSSSFNTYQIFTHYKINFPNSNTRFKKSGNYIIKILDEFGEELFSRKFIIYENLVSVNAEIKRSRKLEFINRKQVVNFEINPINFSINNPNRTVKVNIFKNNNLNNAVKGLKPQYNIGQKLVYRYDNESGFWGENEYLYFENKFIRNTNTKIKGFDLNDIYSNFLYSDYPRIDKKYTYNPDINGKFLINSSNSTEADYEADYVYVHFSLEKTKKIDNESKIYIVGDFNNYEIDENYKMKFNKNYNLFEAKIKLKQGFYNYKYIQVDQNKNTIYGAIDGNFDETENEYNIIVYYRDFGERYDRVIGKGKGLSEFITN